MWLRMLALVFGVTVYAASTVLASFMARPRARQLHRRPDRRPRCARRCARSGSSRSASALSALATPALLDVVKTLWVALQPSLPSSLAFLTVARFVAAFAVLIVPTTLMGATLPIVMRSALVRERAVGSRIGLLYAINTDGRDRRRAHRRLLFRVARSASPRRFGSRPPTNVAIGVVAIAASSRMAGQRRRLRLRGRDAHERAEPRAPPDTAGISSRRSRRACRPVDLRAVRRAVAGARDRLVPDARDLPAARRPTRSRSCWRRSSPASRSAAPSRRRSCSRRGRRLASRCSPSSSWPSAVAAVLSFNALASLQTQRRAVRAVAHAARTRSVPRADHRRQPAGDAADDAAARLRVSDRPVALGRATERMPRAASARSTRSTSSARSPARCSAGSCCCRSSAAAAA